MKKFIYSITVVLFSAMSYGQFTYGPKIGVNMSRFANDKFMPGIQAGAFLNAEIFDRIGIQADFLWAVKGNKNEVTGLDSVLTTTKSYYRFVEIPLCVYIPISKHLRGFAGYQITVLRKGNQIAERKGKEIETKIQGNGENSFIFGFDFKFDSPITLGLRFVTNKFYPSVNGTASKETSNLNSLTVNFGYTMDW